jgi:hypothetical protein
MIGVRGLYHSFNVDLATKYGMIEAILLNHICFWIAKNKANNVHAHDGRYWTYGTMKAFAELYPYLTVNQVRRALERLKEKGLIIDGEYNTKPFDRTKWYTLTDAAMVEIGVDFHVDKACKADTEVDLPPSGIEQVDSSKCAESQMELAKMPQGSDQNARPIPYIITDIVKDNSIDRESNSKHSGQDAKCSLSKAELKRIDMTAGFNKFWDMYPRKVQRPLAWNAWQCLDVDSSLYEAIYQAVEKYKRTKQWQDKNYIPYPATFLQDERWTDDIVEDTDSGGGNVWGSAFNSVYGGDQDG